MTDILQDPTHTGKPPKDYTPILKLTDLTPDKPAYLKRDENAYQAGIIKILKSEEGQPLYYLENENWTHFLKQTETGIAVSTSVPTKAFDRIQITK